MGGPKFAACPECGSAIVGLGGKSITFPDRLEDMPRRDEIPPTVLVCANDPKIAGRNDALVLLANGRGLTVEFARAAG
jgi:hypothetical protein